MQASSTIKFFKPLFSIKIYIFSTAAAAVVVAVFCFLWCVANDLNLLVAILSRPTAKSHCEPINAAAFTKASVSYEIHTVIIVHQAPVQLDRESAFAISGEKMFCIR